MKFVQLVLTAPTAGGTGADLRNDAIAAALGQLGDVFVVAAENARPVGHDKKVYRKSHTQLDFPPHWISNVIAQIADLAPDLVVIEGVQFGFIQRALVQAGHRVVLDMHNIESALQEQNDRGRLGVFAPVRSRKRWHVNRQADIALAQGASAVWVTSQSDKALLQLMTGAARAIDVVPNPIPAWCKGVALDQQSTSPPNALFVGHLGYRPNVVAARRLLRLMPMIRNALPDATMDICGRAPRRQLLRLADHTNGATLTASPEQLGPFYARATAVLVPLTEGGGTRLKVLEAMALGVPVIASAKAVEGLGLTVGNMFLRAETDAEFVAAFATLVKDPGLGASLVAAARAFVHDNHSADVIAGKVKASIAAL